MNSNNEFYVIFDTNVLYQNYDSRADFTKFSFNPVYAEIVNKIEQLDIYEKVVIMLPIVVWNEMRRQILEAHDKQLEEYKKRNNKKIFPEIKTEYQEKFNYVEYLDKIISEYEAELEKSMIKVIELPLVSNAKFDRIIKRAFDKMPPFEGKDSKADKGFKDALLWESILEFMERHGRLMLFCLPMIVFLIEMKLNVSFMSYFLRRAL